MATTTRCRRATRRYSIPENGTAQVEFDHPAPHGCHYSFPVIDISVSGLSFACSEEISGLESGENLPAVTVRIGGCEMHGEILVMHMTSRSSTSRVVGALFYPAQDADLVKWKSLLAGIEVLQTG